MRHAHVSNCVNLWDTDIVAFKQKGLEMTEVLEPKVQVDESVVAQFAAEANKFTDAVKEMTAPMESFVEMMQKITRYADSIYKSVPAVSFPAIGGVMQEHDVCTVKPSEDGSVRVSGSGGPYIEYNLQSTITDNIRKLMKQRGAKHADLAKALGVSTSTVSQKLTDRISWTLTDMKRAAKYFNVYPAALLVAGQGFEPWTSGL